MTAGVARDQSTRALRTGVDAASSIALIGLGAMLALAIAVGIEVGHLPGAPFIALPFYLTGYVILRKVGSQPIGWLLLALGGILQMVTFESLPWLSPLWLNWMFGWGFTAMFALFTWLLILFPEGRASRRWMTAGWVATAMVFAGMFSPIVTDPNDATIVYGASPTGVSWLPEATGVVTNAAVTVFLVAAAIGVVVRSRQAAPALRLRYKPVLAAMAALGLLILVLLVWLIIDPLFTAGSSGEIVWTVALVVYMLLPASFGVAITRYRLYDIDRVVSRTVTYALVAAVVALIYAIPVLTVPRLLGESNDLVVAASTLAAAAAFNPVRRRIQRAVDHRFNRARYDAESQLEMFAARIRSETDLTSIGHRLHDVVTRTLAPEHSAVWLRVAE